MTENDLRQKQNRPFFVVFTDLDGTLLDHDTYRWEDAKPALDLCRTLGFPVVLVSSKTRAEMEPLQREMGISAPFVTENGGGIYLPDDALPEDGAESTSLASGQNGLTILSPGLPYSFLVAALNEIRTETGLKMRGFSDMNMEEIGRLTGLAPEACRLAAMREYDEPFIILEEKPSDQEMVVQAALKRGLAVSLGGRFCHLQSGHDKGAAMEKILSWYGASHARISSVALGDSPNDFSMLACADYPVLVRSRREFPWLKEKIPRLLCTDEPGPKGWNAAVSAVLRSRLPL